MFGFIDWKKLFKDKILIVALFALLIRIIVLIINHPWSDPLLPDDDALVNGFMAEQILDKGNFNYTGIPEI
ncbi:MAG TPA: hypothetical protein VIH28_12100, partial [Ignavibacteriaceae bacterium]